MACIRCCIWDKDTEIDWYSLIGANLSLFFGLGIDEDYKDINWDLVNKRAETLEDRIKFYEMEVARLVAKNATLESYIEKLENDEEFMK